MKIIFFKQLEHRGSDYASLVRHHNIHAQKRDHIAQCLREHQIETKVINRFAYTDEAIQWADLIITSGGDGTFLLAANKIHSNSKPLIGVNSDPSRSVGHLCIPSKYSNDFGSALDKILAGDFEWAYRQRVRITLEGENAYDNPIELHNQQLASAEYRFLELEPPMPEDKEKNAPQSLSTPTRRRILPYRALNEVFIGEALSSRVSYMELTIDNHEKTKVKSSGVTICTGTGSTSWSFNINKLTTQCVRKLFQVINEKCPGVSLPVENNETIQTVTDTFNNRLIFSPSLLTMAYTIRDPIVFETNFKSDPRDFAEKISVRSKMTDAHIVIDGGLSFAFNDGAKAFFEMYEEDALKTIVLK